MTVEHALTQWTGRYLVAYGPFQDGSGGLTAKPQEVTMPLCGPCQRRLNQWFENPAREALLDLFDAKSRELPEPEQLAISRWLVKSAVLFNHALGRPTLWPSEFYDWLKVKGNRPPPVGTTVWIGCLDHSSLTPPSDRDDRLIPSETALPLPLFDAMSSRHSALAIMGLCSFVRFQPESSVPGRFDVSDRGPRPFLSRVWPPEVETLTWPPPVSIDQTGYDYLHYRFSFA